MDALVVGDYVWIRPAAGARAVKASYKAKTRNDVRLGSEHMALALAMAAHPRLGEKCKLPVDVLRLISSFAE